MQYLRWNLIQLESNNSKHNTFEILQFWTLNILNYDLKPKNDIWAYFNITSFCEKIYFDFEKIKCKNKFMFNLINKNT